jgi:hypothetical protein
MAQSPKNEGESPPSHIDYNSVVAGTVIIYCLYTNGVNDQLGKIYDLFNAYQPNFPTFNNYMDKKLYDIYIHVFLFYLGQF